MSSSPTVQEAKEHILEIRRKRGIDDSQGFKDNWNLQDLKRSLETLAFDLYNKETHFLLELIQNADDNAYQDQVPTLELRLYSGKLESKCNEVGFNKAQVESLCRVGHSTKSKNKKGAIGEKGIGFKSVFKVATVATVRSGPYHFRFDTRPPSGNYGMIVPSWVESGPTDHGSTHFPGTQLTLDLKQTFDKRTLQAELSSLDCTFLLFLRKLRGIRIGLDSYSTSSLGHGTGRKYDENGAFSRWHDTSLEDVHAEGGEHMRIRSTSDNPDRPSCSTEYRLFRQSVGNLPKEEKREGIQETEIILAFPLCEKKPLIKAQDVFAFLPVKDYGFSFLIHADFLLTASREDISPNLKWNNTLREGVVKTFRLAILDLVHGRNVDLSYRWPQYLLCLSRLPMSFLEPIASKIISCLRSEKIVLSERQTLETPSQMVLVPNRFRSKTGKMLLDDQELMRTSVSASYPSETIDGLRVLQITTMSGDEFIRAYKLFVDLAAGQPFQQKPQDWHSDVSAILLSEIDRRYGYRWRGTGGAARLDLDRYAIIPLRDGTWVSAQSGPIYFNHPNTEFAKSIPKGIDLRIVDELAAADGIRHDFFTSLDVKTCTPQDVCTSILDRHSTRSGLTVEDWVSHAVYLFDVGYKPGPSESFRFVSASNRLSSVDPLYVAFGSKGDTIRRFFPPTSLLITRLHPKYESAIIGSRQQEWADWLLKWKCLHSIPPPYHNGGLSQHSYHVLNNFGSKAFLTYLKCYQNSYAVSAWTDTALNLQIRELRVAANDGSRTALLGETALPHLKVESHGRIPILDLDDPDDRAWSFLEVFGVITKINLRFYLEHLQNVKRTQPRSLPQDVVGMYESIQKHSSEDRATLVSTFAKEALVCTTRFGWLKANQCIWNASFECTIFPVLCQTYKNCSQLFHSDLGVSIADVNTMALEVSHLKVQERGVVKVKELILAFSKLLQAQRLTPDSFNRLRDVKFIPVQKSGVDESASVRTFVSLQEQFWFADLATLQHAFEGIVWLADFSMDEFDKLGSFIAALNLQDRVLSTAVVSETFTAGVPKRIEAQSRHLRAKTPFILSLLPRHSLIAERSADIKKQLENLNVFSVTSVTLRRKVVFNGTTIYGRDDDGRAVVRENSTNLEIFLKQEDIAAGKLHRSVKDRIVKLCGLDGKGGQMLFHIIDEDEEEIIRVLEEDGIRCTVTVPRPETTSAAVPAALPSAPNTTNTTNVNNTPNTTNTASIPSTSSTPRTPSNSSTTSTTASRELSWPSPAVSANNTSRRTTRATTRFPSSDGELAPHDSVSPQPSTAFGMAPTLQPRSLSASLPVPQPAVVTPPRGPGPSLGLADTFHPSTLSREEQLRSIERAAGVFDIAGLTMTAMPASLPSNATSAQDNARTSTPPIAFGTHASVPSFTFSSPEPSSRPPIFMSRTRDTQPTINQSSSSEAVASFSRRSDTPPILNLSSLSEALPSYSTPSPPGSPVRTPDRPLPFTPPSSSLTPSATTPTGSGGLLTPAPTSHAIPLSPVVTDEYRRIGLLGEKFIYELLRPMLSPNFTEHNWTSNMRRLATRTRFTGRERDFADFTYTDTDGRLSAFFSSLGLTRARDWTDASPRYHLEVKTTTAATLDEPFFLSNNQLAMARRDTLLGRNDDEAPKDVYVVLRVYDLDETGGGRTKVHAYPDPWGLWMRGKLNVLARDCFTVAPANLNSNTS